MTHLPEVGPAWRRDMEFVLSWHRNPRGLLAMLQEEAEMRAASWPANRLAAVRLFIKEKIHELDLSPPRTPFIDPLDGLGVT